MRLQHAPVALAEGWSQPAFSTVFSESLSHGHCVLVQLPQKEQVGDDYRLPGEVQPKILTSVTQVLNERLSGLTLNEIRETLPERLRDFSPEDRPETDELLNIFMQKV